MRTVIGFKATVNLLPHVEGTCGMRAQGRNRPIFNNYKPMFQIHGREYYKDGNVEIVGANEISPGNIGTIKVTFFMPEELAGFEVGSIFKMCEGFHEVAIGEVIEIYESTSDSKPIEN